VRVITAIEAVWLRCTPCFSQTTPSVNLAHSVLNYLIV
jgi:hypothetical protein